MSRQLTAAIALVILMFCAPAWAEPSAGGPVSKDAVREAIAAFQKDPLHLQGSAVRLSIMQFAHDNDDVSVIIGPRPVPWLENKTVRQEDRTTLLTAYIAGNVRAQLDKGKAENDSVAGCEQVIATYRQLQKAEVGLEIPEIEKLIDLQKRGELAGYLKES